MGLEEMLSAIRADTETRYAKTISDAKAEAEKILADARQQADRIVNERKGQAQRELQEEKLRSIASARLEAKRNLLETRDEVLRKYEDDAYRNLREFTQSPQYKDFLTKMVQDGLGKIGPDAVVQVNASDRKLLQGFSDYKLAPENIDCIGGAMISSSDGKRRVDNTLESIFDDRKEELRMRLSQQIFGKQD